MKLLLCWIQISGDRQSIHFQSSIAVLDQFARGFHILIRRNRSIIPFQLNAIMIHQVISIFTHQEWCNHSDSEITGYWICTGKVTDIPEQKDHQKYADMDGLRVEIPDLGVSVPIVSVPLTDGWDLTWLWNKAGWLEGTAYPSWTGNTVITGHAYLPSGYPGPFVNLGDLAWGDEIILYAHGLKYTYQVRAAKLVGADDYSILQHKDQDWLDTIHL